MSNNINDSEVRITYTLRDRASIAINRVRTRLKNLTDQARNSQGVFSRLNTSIAGFGKGLVTSQLGVAGLTAGLVTATKGANDFERAMFQVRNTLSKPITDDYFKQVGDQVKALSLDTGIDSTKLARSLQSIVSSGVPIESSIPFLTDVAKISKASESDILQTSKLLSSAIKNYGLQYENANDLASAFFQTTRDGQADVSKLAQQLPQVFPLSASHGESLADTLALSAVVTGKSNTLESFVTGYKALAGVVEGATTEMVDNADKLGISLGQEALKTHTIIDIMDQMRIAKEKFSKSDISGVFGEGKTDILGTIFGSNQEAKQLALLITSDIENARAVSGRISGSQGVAQEIVKAYNEQGFSKQDKVINRTKEDAKRLGGYGSIVITEILKGFHWLDDRAREDFDPTVERLKNFQDAKDLSRLMISDFKTFFSIIKEVVKPPRDGVRNPEIREQVEGLKKLNDKFLEISKGHGNLFNDYEAEVKSMEGFLDLFTESTFEKIESMFPYGIAGRKLDKLKESLKKVKITRHNQIIQLKRILEDRASADVSPSSVQKEGLKDVPEVSTEEVKAKKLEVDEIVVDDDNFLSKTKKGGGLPEAPKVDKVETEDERLARELQAFIDAEAEKTRILEEQEQRRREIEESATAFSIGLQAGKNENLLEGVAILLQKELQLYIQNEVAKAGISAVGSSLIGFGVGGLLTALTGSLFGSDNNEPTNRGVTYHDAGTNNVYLDKEKVGYTIGDNKQYRERQGYETQ
ncbi:MAG: phage tail tape measure protein [Gammaproteobacteria bacterium]|nr:phage tail tape measure protein [Gammaproteobacteria bacterium]